MSSVAKVLPQQLCLGMTRQCVQVQTQDLLDVHDSISLLNRKQGYGNGIPKYEAIFGPKLFQIVLRLAAALNAV